MPAGLSGAFARVQYRNVLTKCIRSFVVGEDSSPKVNPDIPTAAIVVQPDPVSTVRAAPPNVAQHHLKTQKGNETVDRTAFSIGARNSRRGHGVSGAHVCVRFSVYERSPLGGGFSGRFYFGPRLWAAAQRLSYLLKISHRPFCDAPN